MVFPVNQIKFKIGVDEATATIVKDMETFAIDMAGEVQEWNPMDQNGWVRRLKTGQSMVITFDGKRNIGDPGNDFVATMTTKIGEAATAFAEIEWPDGAKTSGDWVINVTNPGGGASIEVAGLSFELMSNGEPTWTDAP